MTDRLVIEITGALPEKGKHAILAAAEVLADGLAIALRDEHEVEATVSVRGAAGEEGHGLDEHERCRD